MSSLRFGLLVSGAVHVAVAAALSQSPEAPIPPMDDLKPLTLQLSVFEPPQPAASVPAPPEIPEQVVEELVEREEESVVKEMPVEPEPQVAAVQPKPVKPKPRPEKKRPVQKKVVEEVKPIKPKPEPVKPPSTPPPIIAARVPDAKSRPKPVTPVSVEQKQHYLAALAARIDRRKFYPQISRRRGEEGTVVVSFVIDKRGGLNDMAVVESSGHHRLDQAALKTLKRVSPFKPIPDALRRDNWPIRVPIEFLLRG